MWHAHAHLSFESMNITASAVYYYMYYQSLYLSIDNGLGTDLLVECIHITLWAYNEGGAGVNNEIAPTGTITSSVGGHPGRTNREQ